jgi:hypothetical protein
MIASIAVVVTTISQAISQVLASAAFSENYRQQKRWNLIDIEFFDSNFDEKFAFIDETIIHVNKNIYYKNVHVFVEWIKKMIIILEFEMIKKNLSSCLREWALMWHIAKLFDVFSRILSYEENVNEWIQAFIIRFKIQIIIATVNLLKKRYTLTNAKKKSRISRICSKSDQMN